jgi:hypothetical protein
MNENKIKRLHLPSNCQTLEHNNFNTEDFYFIDRPTWVQHCNNPLSEYGTKKLLKICEIFKLECTCTNETDCQLCFNITNQNFDPLLFIDFDNYITLKNLFSIMNLCFLRNKPI